MLDNRVIRSVLLAMLILACVVAIVLAVMAHNATVDRVLWQDYRDWYYETGGTK